MSHSPTITTNAFNSSARERLLGFLAAHGEKNTHKVHALTPDASTREYFRFPWKRKTAVAAVYPEPFDPHFHPYLDVTRLFLESKLPARPRVLCHRDFHASNLMVDAKGRLRIVDHQDARMGPASYDLVTLLLDRQPALPSLAEVRAHRLFLLEERRRRGLDALDPDDFAREFRLMSVQRGLKAIGTFSYQTAVCGRGVTYEQFIGPTFQIVLQAMEWLGRFPALKKAITERMKEKQ